MHPTPPRVLDDTRRSAAVRLHELAQELNLLLGLFPDLDDSFDADELPVSFILKRDARAGRPAVAPPNASRVAVRRAVSRRMKQSWTERRAGTKS